MTLTIVIGFPLVFASFLFFYQRRMIFFPRPYEASYRAGLPAGTIELDYQTNAGRQRAFFLPPLEQAQPLKTPQAPAKAPARLWVFFNGNASLALDWLDTIDRGADPKAGFLLVDYPGYGFCEGSPSRRGIQQSSEMALLSLARHLEIASAELETDLNVAGYSLGAAAGLDFAASRPVRRIVLISPFTSLLDMARRTVGTPLCHIALDRWDNRARLAELLARPAPPIVHIVHGQADTVVPFSMSAELAAAHPSKIQLHAVPGADHGFVIAEAENIIRSLMRSEAKAP